MNPIFFLSRKPPLFGQKTILFFFVPQKERKKDFIESFYFFPNKKRKKKDFKKRPQKNKDITKLSLHIYKYTLPLPVRTHTLWTRFDHPLLFEATSALFLTKETRFFFVSNEARNGSGDLLNDFESGLRFWTVSFYISHLDLH